MTYIQTKIGKDRLDGSNVSMRGQTSTDTGKTEIKNVKLLFFPSEDSKF